MESHFEEVPNENKVPDENKVMRDIVPNNIKYSFDSVSRELEDVCAQVVTLIHTFFNQVGNIVNYGNLVVKVMEFVEDFRDLKPEEKKIVSTRCIAELIHENKDIPDDLMITIPGSIEAVIKMSKKRDLNRDATTGGIAETTYIIKRIIDKIVVMVRERNYDMFDIMSNSFLIVGEIMYLAGSYPSLTGKQKKEIVIEVFKKLLTEFVKTESGSSLEKTFVKVTISILPTVVDILSDVANGKYSINKIIKCKWLPCCKN